MVIKIQTRKPEIPIEIGDLKFSFDTSDESIKEFYAQANEVRKGLENITIDDEENAIEQVKEVLKQGFDVMLGEGAFEQIYALSPSITICTDYFVQLSEVIKRELTKMGVSQPQEEKYSKYIPNKKRQKRK